MSAEPFPPGTAVSIAGPKRQLAIVVETGVTHTRCRLGDGRAVWIDNLRLYRETSLTGEREQGEPLVDSALPERRERLSSLPSGSDLAVAAPAASFSSSSSSVAPPAPNASAFEATLPRANQDCAPADWVGDVMESIAPKAGAREELGSLYPAGPLNVPSDLTLPSPSYRRHTWVASVALSLFVAMYLGLTGWIVWSAVRTLHLAFRSSTGAFAGFLGGGALCIISLFLLKGVFGIRRGGDINGFEATADDEPVLFDFLNRLADEVGAPRPHRVFLAPEVTAAVFYDLSLLNLLLPSRKNLIIGLGAVNALTLSELKAVLAHELGHFAQRSMAVGRWVYTAQQVAAHLVHQRDWMDRSLVWLGRVDLRVAWIAWGFQLTVWSIRAVVDTLFGAVAAAERALSREMELHADLVSVSVSGSDALVHALHRLGGADEAWSRSAAVMRRVHFRGASVEDAYGVQTTVLRRLRRILNDEQLGASPKRPKHARAGFRVFELELAQPPRMWMTHPPNREREDNAKQRYVDAVLDERDAWRLFRDPVELRRRMTRELSSLLAEGQKPPAPDAAVVKQVIVEQYGHVALDPRFFGVYLQEPVVLLVTSAQELLSHTVESDQLSQEIAQLYPASLREDCERVEVLCKEQELLDAFRQGVLDAPGGALRYRGKALRRSDVDSALSSLEVELKAAKQRLVAQQRRCRSTHLALARQAGQGWDDYVSSLTGLWHYLCHALVDLSDAFGHWNNTLSVALADGKVSRAERKRLVKAGAELHDALMQVHATRAQVVLTERIAVELEVTSWDELLGSPYQLETPSIASLQSFAVEATAFAEMAIAVLSTTQRLALLELLTAEGYLARQFNRTEQPAAAPTPACVPPQYKAMTKEQERHIQRRLGWKDRFALATAIVGVLLGATVAQQKSRVIVYNGLDVPATVMLGGASALVVPALQTRSVRVPATEHLHVQASLEGALVDDFRARSDNYLGQYVYNVAGAVPLEHWTAVYGSETSQRHEASAWRTDKWFESDADYVLRPPPKQLKTRSGRAASRKVLSAPGQTLTPSQMLSLVPAPERSRIVELHTRFGRSTSRGKIWGSQPSQPVRGLSE